MFFLCIGLMAQTNDSAQEQKATQMTQVLNEVLQLDAKQVEQAQLVNLVCIKMADEIREKYATDRAMLDKKIEETKIHRDERILKILTPTQTNTYRTTLKEIARFNSIADKEADKESLENLRVDVPKVQKLVHDLYNF